MQVDEALVSAEAGPSEPLPPTTNGALVTENGVTAGEEVKVEEEPKKEEEEADVEMVESLPEGASEVLYLNNLNENIKLDG